mmetsp:Transcript_23266/g.37044  ORF Transcript_23266/g.37044 Transcript_23266/m.37044 type:complete len:91 (-) Transcript_23266:2300-2572(-)
MTSCQLALVQRLASRLITVSYVCQRLARLDLQTTCDPERMLWSHSQACSAVLDHKYPCSPKWFELSFSWTTRKIFTQEIGKPASKWPGEL